VVARLFRLRIALLGSVFRGGFRAIFRTVLTAILAIALAVGYAWLPGWLSNDAAGRASIGVFLASALMAAIALVPLFANVRNLEPRQFAAFPARPGSVATALLLSTVLSWPMIWLLVWMAALVVLQPDWAVPPWALLVSALLTIGLSISLVRVSSGAVHLLVPRRAIGGLRWIGLLIALAALPLIVFLLTDAVRSAHSSAVHDTAEVLGWTPLGAPAAGLAYLEQGDVSAAVMRFAAAGAALLVLVALWYLIVARSLSTVERPDPDGVNSDGLELFERFPAHPREVIAARSLTYWRRDPRYRVALFAIPIAPIVMVAALWIAGVDPAMLSLLPLPVILLLLGWSLHNDVAYDSTAIWMHVASGTKGVHDRAGRLAPVLVIGLPLVILGSSLTVTVAGDWRTLPAVIGLNFAVLLVSAGAASVFSVLMPYPATRPGDSPFAQPAVQGSGAGLAQTLSMLVALILAVPPVLFAARPILEPELVTNLIALGFGVGWGLLVLWLCTLIGGRVFERGAPELVALTQTFD